MRKLIMGIVEFREKLLPECAKQSKQTGARADTLDSLPADHIDSTWASLTRP